MVNKLNKEAKHTLDLALRVLEHAMELASEKEDLEAIIAISDRLMMLYQHLSDKNVKKFKTGFSIEPVTRKKDDEEEDTEYESD
ncbi:MAG: hypothetical protein RLZZ196_81 [Bacteroidota bacterium]|jgi:hypothetical protein